MSHSISITHSYAERAIDEKKAEDDANVAIESGRDFPGSKD
jgi:hypothetical protein